MKRWLKRVTPDRARVRGHRQLRVFGKRLHDPNLWHLNRRSVAGACALGLFVMYLPPLGQTLLVAAGAIALRVNLPISMALIWVTNPVTIPPMYYFSYRVGSWLLGAPARTLDMEYWFEWRNWLEILAPLTVGGLVCGILCAVLGYCAVQVIWRWSLVRRLRRRRVRQARRPRGSAPRHPDARADPSAAPARYRG